MAKIQFIEEQCSVEVDYSSSGQSLLAASLAAGIPHYTACGGNARCSTCRILVLEGIDSFGPRGALESEIAARRRWPATVRLACQSFPSGDATVRRIVHDEIDADLVLTEQVGWPTAEEREIALLFCDITGFTKIAESHLAYDVVHSLNRFFKQVGDPILANGGVINKYLGDGLLALFGVEGLPHEESARRAVRAALRMLAAARALNVYFQDHFGFSFEPRIGLHFGRVLVGQTGHPEKMDSTVIGDAVNTASRIENANKRLGTQLLASAEFVGPLLESLQFGRVFENIRLRGRRERVRLYEITGFREVDTIYLVQSTFELIAPIADTFAQTFYDRFFLLDPAIGELFSRTDMREMRRMLMRMIALTIRGLPALSPMLRDLGARHVGYGVRPEYYPLAGESLLHALQVHLGPTFTPEVRRAWEDIFSLISETMLHGASAAS